MGTSRIASLFGALALVLVPACTGRAPGRDGGPARLDASAPDAAEADGATLDASALDGSAVVDASSPDASRLDASMRDAALRDAAFDAARDGALADAAADARVLPDARPVDGGGGCAAPSVGLFAADDAPAHDSVRTFLMGTEMVGSVTVGGPVTEGFTPTVAQLLAYDVVFVWGSGSWNGAAFGNVLADYVEAGGGVVVAVFAQRPGAVTGLSGRIETAGYLPYVPSEYMFGAVALGTVAVPSHPIMAGVTTFGGGSVAYHDGPISGGATLIASLSNGRPLVATMEPALGRTALLGFYPVRLWDTSTDGARLMVNTLRWAACR